MEETQIRKYFLGRLTEAEHEDFDRWLMTGRDSVEMVEAYEDRLIDDYVHGALPAEDRARFESHFLVTPGRLGKLRLINSLIGESALAEEEGRGRRASAWGVLQFAPRPKFWVVRAAFASAAAALLHGGAWSAFRYWPSEGRDSRLRAEQTNATDRQNTEARTGEKGEGDRRPAESPQPPQQPAANEQESAGLEPKPRQSPPSHTPRTPRMVAVSFSLSPGRVRDEVAADPLRIPPGTDLVRLMLELEGDDYNTYRARLRRADGEVLWQRTLRKAGNTGRPVIARISAKLLVEGEYILSLSGLTTDGIAEEAGNYYFKVAAH